MTLRDVHLRIVDHGVQIEKLLKTGAKVSIIVRNPDQFPDRSGDMLVGNDDWIEVVKSIKFLRESSEEKRL